MTVKYFFILVKWLLGHPVYKHIHTHTDWSNDLELFRFYTSEWTKGPPFQSWSLHSFGMWWYSDWWTGSDIFEPLSHGTLLFLDNHEVGDSRLLQMLVTVYQSAWYHVPEDRSLHHYSCENLKICCCTFPWSFEFLVCSLLSSWCLPLPTFSIWISIASLINFCEF